MTHDAALARRGTQPTRTRQAAAKKAWHWARPTLLLFACAFVQSLLLHCATALYVADMAVFHAQLSSTANHSKAAPPGGRAGRVRRAILYDVLGEALGARQSVSLGLLDLSGLVPMVLFLALTLGLGRQLPGKAVLQLWNRLFIVAAALALIKGTFDTVTIIPSSDGWDACLQRLRGSDADIVKPGGVLRATLGGTRYCADMIVSGHTNLAALFSLGTYQLVSLAAESGHNGDSGPILCPLHLRTPLRACVALICLACLATEFVLVIWSKFHYTVDLLASLLLVALFSDSRAVESLCADWVRDYDANCRWGDLLGWSWARLCGVRIGGNQRADGKRESSLIDEDNSTPGVHTGSAQETGNPIGGQVL